MAKKMQIISILSLILLIIAVISSSVFAASGSASQQNIPEVHVFQRAGCIHCANMEKFLEDISSKYNFKVIHYDISDPKNADLLQKFAVAYSTEVQGVPTIFVGDQVFVGDAPTTKQALESQIQNCISDKCEIKSVDNKVPAAMVTIPALLGAAAVDAINPCAFAVLIILLTTVLSAGKENKKKALISGLVFSAAVYISYFLMGLGLYSAVQVTGVTHIFYIIVSLLALVIGLFNIKDYFWYGKWFIMEVPRAWRPRMKILLKSVTSVPGAFFVGIVVSLFLLPCSSGPYIVIIGLLSKAATRASAIPLLLLYNLIFILPMVIITLAIYFGLTTTEKAEQWRQRELKVLHLIAGIIILLLGIGMLASLYLGWL
jgi:cytochrome c biogenesis protein CcdA